MGGRRARRDHPAVKSCLGALLAIAAAGCAVEGPAIDITQRGVLIPSARATFSRHDTGAAFELAVARAAGKGPQTLYAGEGVQLRDRGLAGPRQLENEADVRIADAWLRVRTFHADEKFGQEMLAGLSLIRADFAVRSGAQTISDSWVTQGVSLGYGLLYRATPQTTLHARYSFTLTGRAIEQTHIHRLELAGVQALGRHVAARAGYSWWSVDATPPTGSEITVRLSGPMLGLDLSF